MLLFLLLLFPEIFNEIKKKKILLIARSQYLYYNCCNFRVEINYFHDFKKVNVYRILFFLLFFLILLFIQISNRINKKIRNTFKIL